MARIIYSGLVTSIRGSVGGTTFQNNAYGFTIKNKANIIRPNTSYQERQKVCFSKAVKAWSLMSPAQRDNWNSWAAAFPQFAKHNPSSVLSGYAAFVKYHALYFLGEGLDATVLTSPSFDPLAYDTVVPTLSNSLSILTLAQTWAIGDGSWKALRFISRPFLNAQNFAGTAPKYLDSVTSENDSGPITTLYTNLFGRIPADGENVFIEYQLYGVEFPQIPARTSFKVTVT